MPKGTLNILNVGHGDIRLSFDPAHPAEVIRANRIVTDMLRRGFALLVEVDDGKGGKVFTRAKAFDEKTSSYIIADFDPTPTLHDEDTYAEVEAQQEAEAPPVPAISAPEPKKRGRPKLKDRAVPAAETRAVAVSRSAGG